MKERSPESTAKPTEDDVREALFEFVIRTAKNELATPAQLDAMAEVVSSLGILA